ncbi:hypothetical protein [Burkholderia ubonensis]|uniref:hypothetical protein n=1 Tax=Burkholderia ubonensis TaxID=101571 RepID=UPI00075C71E0|nr:hypothetical protein [Burkholderia ubonensis]KVV07462.1 hypothetical protein WK77_16890 [Burkholderia ubonensis]
MAETKQRGVDRSEELESSQIRPDTRPLLTKARTYFSTTDGVVAAMLWLQGIALLTVFVPMSGEIVLVASWLFYQWYVNPGHNDPKRKIPGTNRIAGKFRIYDFPYRVPFAAKRFDGSYAIPRLGSGITYLGKEISSKLEIWSSDSDLRTHQLVLGTTGSGKTELLLGLVFNALVQNSGFIYTDGKGDVALWNNVFRLARYLGRECDLLLINFLTSGRDFLDKQVDRTTNTMNPFALGSSGMLIELIISLMDDSGGGGDMWKGRAIAFVAGLTRVLCFLRDRGYILLDSNKFIEYFELPVIEQIVWDKKITIDGKEIQIKDPLFDKVLEPLKAFVLTLPGYTQEKKGKQEQKTLEQHGFITMQLTRLFGDLSFTYGYIFQTLLGEVDMYDVVINRRILAVLLPALERAPDSLKMLGKLIVGAIKQMMAGCLGNRVEGSVREIVKARPTNAAVPFYVVLDEYGYYAVLGFAVAPAQARSLGFPQPMYARVRMADGSVRTMAEVRVGDEILSPNGAVVRIAQVLDYEELPIARLTLESGRTVDAACVHHWPVRVMYQQLRVMTTQEIEVLVKSGVTVELAIGGGSELGWEAISSIAMTGNQPARCLVVDDEMHCYMTDHDIITHNCITFAAQDFSSLQKASKEEADATWENTNVRCVGRITSGEKSETWERIRGVAGEALVYENGAKEHNADSMFKWSTNMDARVNRVKRLEYDDLAHQENGEFTFLIGKKDSQSSGGVRVIRARTFFTQVEEAPAEIRINHFLKVAPPRSGVGEQDIEQLDRLEELLGKMIADGSLAKAFPNEPEAMLAMKQPFYKMSLFMREAREKHSLSLPEAWRVAFVCDDQETKVMAGAAALAAAPAAADGELLASSALVAAVAVPTAAGDPESDVAVLDERPEEPSFDMDLLDEAPVESGVPVTDASVLGLEPISLDLDFDPLALGSAAGAKGQAGGAGAGDAGSDEAGGGRDGGASGGSGSSGGMGMALKPIPVSVEGELPVAADSLDPKTQVTDFLDGYDFGRSEEQGEDSAVDVAGAAGTEEPQMRVSALTFRVLGQAEEPNEIQSYLADAIETTRIALGTSRDSLENKAAAQRGVQELERVTSYVEGLTPGAATLEDWDATIEDLENAADANPPNWM